MPAAPSTTPLHEDAASFGGAWFDPKTGVVNVAGTTDAANSRAVALGKQYGVAVRPRRSSTRAAALEAEAAQLRAGKGEFGQAAKGNVGVDVMTNEVVVAVPRDRSAALAASAEAARARRSSPPRATIAEPDAGCTSRAACDWTIRAGAIMWRGRTRRHAVVLGRLHGAQLEQPRFVYTAGHCTTGNCVTWGTGAQNIGPMWSSLDSGAIDASIILVNNSWFTGDLGGEIYIEDGGARTAPVKGVAPTVGYMVAGETVCLAANFTRRQRRQPLRHPRHQQRRGRARHGAGRRRRRLRRRQRRRLVLAALVGQPLRLRHPQPQRQRLPRRRRRGRSWYTAIANAKNGFQPSLNVETR